jgi:hypothetical protein
MYKLLMRAFPSWFRGDSVYAMFPFTVPEETREILRSLGKEQDYSYEKPAFVSQPQAILTWEGVTSVLDDQATFKVPCELWRLLVHCDGTNLQSRGTSYQVPNGPGLHAQRRRSCKRRAEKIRR